MEVGGYPKPTFPCISIPFDPTGPYAMNETVLTSEQCTIWVNSCQAPLVAHKMAGWDRLYHNFTIRQPALLVHRGWGCIMLYAEPDGLALLEDAQTLVGVGRDKQFDDHIDLIRAYVERMLIDHDNAWNRLEDPENEIWLQKWIPLRPKPENIPITTEIDTLLQTVIENWGRIKELLSPDEAVRRYNRLQTNQLEGLFRLHSNSISRLVRIGFFPPALEVLKEGSLYFETPDEAQSKVTHVCEDMLKAIRVVVSQSEGRVPIDATGVKNLHFKSTFHSRFIHADPGPPPIYAIIFPGTFRQAVCSTTYDVEDKVGVVQYCNFREVPCVMDDMLFLFNEYLKASPASPINALKISAWSHAWFGLIHPFGDGNGRVGRLLSSIPLLQHGLPPINIMGSPGGR